MSNELYSIRGPTPEDINFILATWLRGLYYGDSWFETMPKDLFMEKFKIAATNIMMSPKVKVRVACDKEDPTVIFGYSVCSADDEAVIWVFVKKPFRQQGIARSLLPASPKYVTLLTGIGKMLMPKLPTAVFNPFW